MGKDLYERFPLARDLFAEAKAVLGFDLAALCFEGPAEKLTLTANTQPAILTVSVIAGKLLLEKGIVPEITAGHSLGEYSALVIAGGLNFKEAVAIVHQRGKFMQEAVAPGKGAMAAIIGLKAEEVTEICKSSGGIVQPANFNSPEQTVIAGEKSAVDQAMNLAREKGAKKVIPLLVSAPFHSTLMLPAQEKLALELDKLDFQDLKIPIVTNVDAKKVNTAAEIKDALKRQVSAAVKWTDSLEVILQEGSDIFIEAGPSRVLSGLMRRINKNVTCLNVEDQKSLEETVLKLN
jgi:[acyl-carrier-protein] S-malonyltransferase